jgi:hypothetical protein
MCHQSIEKKIKNTHAARKKKQKLMQATRRTPLCHQEKKILTQLKIKNLMQETRPTPPPPLPTATTRSAHPHS